MRTLKQLGATHTGSYHTNQHRPLIYHYPFFVSEARCHPTHRRYSSSTATNRERFNYEGLIFVQSCFWSHFIVYCMRVKQRTTYTGSQQLPESTPWLRISSHDLSPPSFIRSLACGTLASTHPSSSTCPERTELLCNHLARLC